VGCQSTAQDSLCDDGVECTFDSCDDTIGCEHFPKEGFCDDGEPCTFDSCGPAGCLHQTVPDCGPNTSACYDGTPAAAETVLQLGNPAAASIDTGAWTVDPAQQLEVVFAGNNDCLTEPQDDPGMDFAFFGLGKWCPSDTTNFVNLVSASQTVQLPIDGDLLGAITSNTAELHALARAGSLQPNNQVSISLNITNSLGSQASDGLWSQSFNSNDLATGAWQDITAVHAVGSAASSVTVTIQTLYQSIETDPPMAGAYFDQVILKLLDCSSVGQ
jgi:hypothetical protein